MTYARMEYVQSDHYDMNIEPEGSFDLRQKRWKWGGLPTFGNQIGIMNNRHLDTKVTNFLGFFPFFHFWIDHFD